MMKIAITGANSGIGFAAARELAMKGHEIIMICRSQERGETARQKILDKIDHDKVHLYLADLADLDTIHKVAQELKTDFDYLDILMNNAGMILMDYQTTEIGMEKTLAINHLGHFLLTDELLPLILKGENPRIINTSSGAHYAGSFDFSDLNYENSKYRGFPSYSRSKLANILFTRKIERMNDDNKLSIFSIHPGFVGSNFAKNNGLLAKIAMTLVKPFAKSITSGAQPLIYLATEDSVDDQSGEYFQDHSWIPFTGPKIGTKKTSKISYDQKTQDKLWEVSKDYIKKWNPDYSFNFDEVFQSS